MIERECSAHVLGAECWGARLAEESITGGRLSRKCATGRGVNAYSTQPERWRSGGHRRADVERGVHACVEHTHKATVERAVGADCA